MLQRIPVKNPEIVWRELEGEGVLLNPADGKYFGLNTVGLSMWEKVDGARTLEEIIMLLLDEYAVERPVLERDIVEWVSRMNAGNLLLFKG